MQQNNIKYVHEQIKDAGERIDLLIREAATRGARGEHAVYQPDVEVHSTSTIIKISHDALPYI